jgi:hypothetical protein
MLYLEIDVLHFANLKLCLTLLNNAKQYGILTCFAFQNSGKSIAGDEHIRTDL